MTLILTELSHAGIAMAADSAISKSVNGKIVTKDQLQWNKLLRVARINSGVSYWGSIGLIAKGRFDEWLDQKIQNGSYTDLRSFTDYLAGEMNYAVGNKPLGKDQQVGIHVAGFERSPDGTSMPTLFHIHNGHSRLVFQQKYFNVNGKKVVVETIPKWEILPRKLFARHNDFSFESQEPDALRRLDTGYLTTNGDYAEFSMIFNSLRPLIESLNTVPGFSIPARPNELGPRLGFLKTLIEFTINIYKCSSKPKVIGGKVHTLGIRADGTYIRS
jgi:hypothetical protein